MNNNEDVHFPDYYCTTGDNFAKNFWTPYLLADYSSILPLVFSFLVIGRALQKWRLWWVWLVISILIAIQSASSLIFSASFVCTRGIFYDSNGKFIGF